MQAMNTRALSGERLSSTAFGSAGSPVFVAVPTSSRRRFCHKTHVGIIVLGRAHQGRDHGSDHFGVAEDGSSHDPSSVE